MHNKINISDKNISNSYVIQDKPLLRFNEFNDNWNNNNLSNICKIQMGQSPSSENYTKNPNDTILVQGNIDLENGKVVPRLYTTKITKISRPGDIILTVRAPVGDIAINEYNCCIGRGVCSIEGNKFIYYLLEQMKMKDIFKKYSQGSTFESINSKDIKNLRIFYPSLKEQEKIANFLEVIDKKIILMQKTLVLYQKDITYNINSIYSNLDQYKELKIKDIFENYSSNLSINQLEENAGEYSLYGAEGIIKYIDFYELDKPYISIIKDGAGVGRLNLCEPNSSTLGTLQCLIPKDEFNINFLYFYLKTLKFEKYIVGSTIPHIYFKDYSKEKLIIPSLNMQNLIGNYFLKLNKRSNLVKNKIKQLQLFKKGLLQKMFV